MPVSGMPVSVERVRARAGLAEFIRLPARLYGGDPSYVSPLDREQYSLLLPRRGGFFSHGYASYWIARRGRSAVGRISAQVDRLAAPRDGGRVGFFGCLDAADDGEAVAALTAVAERWLQAQRCAQCQGPYMLSINGQSGLLVEGQETRPMIGMPWHPRYLAGLLESCGYTVAKALRSYQLPLSLAPAGFDNVGMLGQDLKIRPMRFDRLDQEAELCRALFNDAWKRNWGFVPMSQRDMRALMRDIKPILTPDCAVVAEHRGQPVAFLLLIPNIFDAARGLGPSPGPLGWLRLLYRIKRLRYDSARIVLLGISPTCPAIVRAAALIAIFTESIRRIRIYGQTKPGEVLLEAGWVLEDNSAMIRILEYFRFVPVRSYNLYSKPLPQN